MVSRLHVKGKSRFWDMEPGELPEVQQGGRTHGQQENARSSSTHAMITTVYIVEAGPVNYKAAMETAEAA